MRPVFGYSRDRSFEFRGPRGNFGRSDGTRGAPSGPPFRARGRNSHRNGYGPALRFSNAKSENQAGIAPRARSLRYRSNRQRETLPRRNEPRHAPYFRRHAALHREPSFRFFRGDYFRAAGNSLLAPPARGGKIPGTGSASRTDSARPRRYPLIFCAIGCRATNRQANCCKLVSWNTEDKRRFQRQVLQYPPISVRATVTFISQSCSICCLSCSYSSLSNSRTFPQRKQAI